jgi:LuxR family maltose regulon positive regulatory protein
VHTRIEEAARATLQLKRLIESHATGVPPRYAAALRMLQASVLAADDRFAEARSILVSATTTATENPVSAIILQYLDWKGQRHGSYVAANGFDYLNPVNGGNAVHRIFGLCVSAAVEFDSLRPTVAANLAAEALEFARRCYGNSAAVTVLPAVLMARVAYEQARFEEAELLLLHRLPAIRTCGFVECAATAFMLLARLAVRRGEHRSALALLREAEAIGRARQWSRLLSVVAKEQARAFAAREPQIEDSARFNADRRQQPREQARRPLAPSESGMMLRYSRLETALARAAMAVSVGCIDDGYQILIPWLRIGAARGLCTVFSDAGCAVVGLLKNIYHGSHTLTVPLSDLRPYLATVLKSAAPKSSRHGANSSYRPLSRRETGILELITHGMSNKRIAQSLGITPETVKTHAKSIFFKLESRTRAQAVARAEAIGLL